jgi:hypothetical protein
MIQFNLEEEQLKHAAKELADGIDFRVIADYLVDSGWTIVELEFESREHSIDILLWVETHCRGKHKRFGGTFVFEDSKDALLFELKWL